MRSLFVVLSALLVTLMHMANASSVAPTHDGKHDHGHGPPTYGDSQNGRCETLLERKEWRTLTDTEKRDYIKAVQCLQRLAAKKPVNPASVSRFDEFQGFHISIAERVHLAGQFLPWHRHFLKRYELALRNECNYKGAAPYWDWTQDADEASSISGSPIFDTTTGFGTNGVPGTYTIPDNVNSVPQIVPTIPSKFRGCVLDGPFANLTLHLGPGKLNTTHCLTRGTDDTLRVRLNSAAVANTTKLRTFEEFRVQLEGQPITDGPRMHDGGHFSVGGEMSNFYSSPGDPIFYLHHANLDRVWWNWQQMLPQRLYEISGRSTIDPPYVNVTLDFALIMDPLGPTVRIRDVMDIHTSPSCYTYV